VSWKDVSYRRILSLCSVSWLPWHEHLFSAMWSPPLWFCLIMGLETMKPIDHGLKSLKLWASTNPSSFVSFLRYFVTVIKNWLTQSLPFSKLKFLH
jgi:hypothetical protein